MDVITELIEAGNIDALRRELQGNLALIHTRNELGDYPINTACILKEFEAAKLLLELGANPNSIGDFGRTPLYNAIDNGNPTIVDIVKLLIERGADQNIKDESGYDLMTWTILELGAGNGFDEVSQILKAASNLERRFHDGSDSATRTEFLTEIQNQTGYSQVVMETDFAVDVATGAIGDPVKRVVYTIGHDQITQTTFLPLPNGGEGWGEGETHFFGTDGHGSVRVLYQIPVELGEFPIAQVYHFDAYGNLLNNGGTSNPTSALLTRYLYNSEAFDFNIQLQYLRARFYDARTGRLPTIDPFFGNLDDPQSFHKYAYVHGDPIQGIDPTGMFTLGGLSAGISARFGMGGAKIVANLRAFYHVFQVIDRVQDIFSTLVDVYDLITMDPSDLLAIGRSVMSARVFGNIPNRKQELNIDLPNRIHRRLKNFNNKYFSLVGPARAQQLIGEIATALIIRAIGFKQADVRLFWHAVHGPDQIARHEGTGTWGILKRRVVHHRLVIHTVWAPKWAKGGLNTGLQKLLGKAGFPKRSTWSLSMTKEDQC